MQKKKGISLIVLVITIIVMIILAAAIIVSLNNNNIIGKAKDAVTETNLKQVQELAQTIWAEAYIEGARTQEELYDAVMEGLEEAKVDTSKYTITVTTSGATVTSQELNEYGFYFDKLYVADAPSESSFTKIGIVLHADGAAEYYVATEYTNNVLYCMEVVESGITYSENKAIQKNEDGTEAVMTFSENGTAGTNDGIEFVCSSQVLHGAYKDCNYSYTVTEGAASIRFNTNGKALLIDGATSEEQSYTLKGDDHIAIMDTITVYISADGTSLVTSVMNGIILKLESQNSETVEGLAGAIITPVEGSSVESIKAGNPIVGDTVEYNGYIYKYDQIYFYNDWYNTEALGNSDKLYTESRTGGWGVKVADTTLTSYPNMESTLYGLPVKNLFYTFNDCVNLKVAPTLSSQAVDMFYAFYGCSSLTSVTIPDSVKALGGTFIDCKLLEVAPNIPENVVDLGNAFFGCEKLTTIGTLPEGVIDMSYTFCACKALIDTPNIPTTVTSMAGIFENCVLLTDMPTIPDKVTSLSMTFLGCTSLVNITTIPDSVTDMDSTFSGCISLTTAPAIPVNVTSLLQTFKDCTSLTGTVTINATNLGDYYDDCFRGTTQPIVLAKTDCTVLEEIANTSQNGNVTVAE